MSNYKLYIWNDVLEDYTSGIGFAMAESVEQARDLVKEQVSLGYKSEFDKEPDAIYDVPGAGVCYGGG